MLVLAALLFGAFGCGAMLATALWQLIASRFVVGLSSGALVACIIAVIGDGFSGREQSRWLGYNGAVATFAILFLNPLAGVLADTGWQRGFLIYAAAVPMLVLILLGVAPMSRPMPAARHPSPDAGAVSPVADRPGRGCRHLATGTSLYWPFRLRELGVHSARDIALYALPNILLIGTAAFGYGMIRRRLSIGGVFMIGGFLCALGLIVAGMAQQPWIVAVGLILEGAGVGLLTPNLSMYAISISPPESSARTIGLMKGALFGSPFVTQFALEPMSRAGGAGAALCGIAALSFGLGAFMLARALGWRSGLPATA